MVDKTELDKIMEDATREFQKENPGQTLNQKQLDAMRSSIENNLASNDSIRTKTSMVTGAAFTTLNGLAVGADGAAMYAAGAKGNIPGQMRSYGYDLRVNAAELKTATGALASEGLVTAAGRSAGMSTLRSTGAALGRLSIPLTVGLGAYETVHNIQIGDRKGAYEAGTGTALSLGASIAAGAAVGTIATPLVGTLIGAGVGVVAYYGGRWLGGEIADATDPKRDFKAAAQPVSYGPTRMSAMFDPKMFMNAPTTQSAFSSAVKPAGIDVTKQVAEPNTNATNDPEFKKKVQSYTYG